MDLKPPRAAGLRAGAAPGALTALPAAGESPLAGYAELPGPRQPWIEGYLRLGERSIPRVSTRLTLRDRLGAWRMRWGVGRGNYRVTPGLYAAGQPGPDSPLLASANYKLSFDALRSALDGLDAWILVLDTKGINVWCAAGKGTFGTAELVDKLGRTRARDIVSHNVIVLPQLGAPGVSAPELARTARFRVAWGPVRAADLPAYIAAGMRASAQARRVTFGIRDRIVLAPVELVQAWPLLAASLALAALAAALGGPGRAARFAAVLVPTAGSVLAGTVAFPALLPWLPTRSFAVKGAVLGGTWGAASALALGAAAGAGAAAMALSAAGFGLAGAAVTAFLGMNFTGCSTFTCQAGANLEVEKGIVPMAAGLALGLCLAAAPRILGL